MTKAAFHDGDCAEHIPVSRFIIHESYDDNTMDNDIALMQLERAVSCKSDDSFVLLDGTIVTAPPAPPSGIRDTTSGSIVASVSHPTASGYATRFSDGSVIRANASGWGREYNADNKVSPLAPAKRTQTPPPRAHALAPRTSTLPHRNPPNRPAPLVPTSPHQTHPISVAAVPMQALQLRFLLLLRHKRLLE